MEHKLPKSLLDVIEHVELNKSGWWDAALCNVVLAATWMHGKPLRRAEVSEVITAAFNLDISADRIIDCIDRLEEQGKFKVQADNYIVPAASVIEQMEARLRAAESNEEIVKASFIDKVKDCCRPHSPEQAWTLFIENCLLSLVDILGARTLQIIGGTDVDNGDVASLTNNFVALFESSQQASLRSAIASFLDPEDIDVRGYITEHLDASFLVKASGLTSDAIANISKFGQATPTFRLVLDTNFLFSLLDLHENPSNESAQVLGRTIQQVGNHLSVRMSVIFPTMDELKRTLLATKADLGGMRMSKTLLAAALDIGISGIVKRFIQANREASHDISPRDYFEPYLRDLTPILRSKGIDVYNEQTDSYKLRSDVLDDLHELMGANGEKQRRYNAALHDSILWHFVNDKRPGSFESPLEAVFWVVTNDYRLLSFDRKRQHATKAIAGVCIHPAELVQILRMWEPRSTDMEQALMSGLRLPFMFYEFNSGEEAASMRVLKALSRFDHISDLDPSAIRDIVLNEAVRAKTAEAKSEEEEIEIVHDALLAERSDIIAQRDAAITKADQVEKTLSEQRKAGEALATANIDQQKHYEARILELEGELKEIHEEARFKDHRIATVECLIKETDSRHQMQLAITKAILTRGVAGGILAALLFAGLGVVWSLLGETSNLLVSISLIFAWLPTWMLVVTVRVHNKHLREWSVFATILGARRLIFGLIAALFLAVIGNAIWQELIHPIWFS